MFTERFFKECALDEIYDVLKARGGNVMLTISGEGISFSANKCVKVIGYVEYDRYNTPYYHFDIESNGIYYSSYRKEYLEKCSLKGFELRTRSINYNDLSSEDLDLIATRVKEGNYVMQKGNFCKDKEIVLKNS